MTLVNSENLHRAKHLWVPKRLSRLAGELSRWFRKFSIGAWQRAL
ncbi:MAG: hypothetical protein OXI87_18335 [Albidovulum sp.]|nr:hypothetical protein [Albidovulum sp.]